MNFLILVLINLSVTGNFKIQTQILSRLEHTIIIIYCITVIRPNDVNKFYINFANFHKHLIFSQLIVALCMKLDVPIFMNKSVHTFSHIFLSCSSCTFIRVRVFTFPRAKGLIFVSNLFQSRIVSSKMTQTAQRNEEVGRNVFNVALNSMNLTRDLFH